VPAPTATQTRAPVATLTATRLPTATLTSTLAPTSTPGIIPQPEPTPPRHYVVMLVIDAGRMAYLQQSHLPHIEALMRHGIVYDRAWVGELNSSTPNVHVTFGTGTLPRENGFTGFGWVSPITHRSIDFRTLLADGEIDPVLNSLSTPSIAARLHELIPGAISIAASGHKDYATVGLGGGSATYELYGKFGTKTFFPAFMHAPPPLTAAERRSLVLRTPLAKGMEDNFAIRYAVMVAKRVKPRLLMINLPEADTWGHWFGPNDKTIMDHLMQSIDRGIGQIEAAYSQMGILDRTDFIITADHSMMLSRPSHNWGQIQDIATTVGAKVVRGDGEGGAIWLQDPSQAQAVAQRIATLRPAHVEAIFYRGAPGLQYRYVQASPLNWLANSKVSVALQHLVDTTAGRDGPDLWVLFHENYSVVPRNVQGLWKGTHGGSTWKVQHVPLIISGPGIRSNVHSQFAARAMDIAPTIERLLGLPAIQRDGVILADALTNPTKQEVRPQHQIAAWVGADVDALQAQSQQDDSGLNRWWPVPPPWPVRCKIPPAKPAPPVIPCGSTAESAANQ
jgi:arylsulfatase A-like enzyme